MGVIKPGNFVYMTGGKEGSIGQAPVRFGKVVRDKATGANLLQPLDDYDDDDPRELQRLMAVYDAMEGEDPTPLTVGEDRLIVLFG